MAWIKPTNGKLVAVVSANWSVGFGFNPLSTFDYAYLTNPGEYILCGWGISDSSKADTTLSLSITTTSLESLPAWSCEYSRAVDKTDDPLIVNSSLIVWSRNGWSTGYLPVNASTTYDNTGSSYSVTNIIDANGVLDEAKYQSK